MVKTTVIDREDVEEILSFLEYANNNKERVQKLLDEQYVNLILKELNCLTRDMEEAICFFGKSKIKSTEIIYDMVKRVESAINDGSMLLFAIEDVGSKSELHKYLQQIRDGLMDVSKKQEELIEIKENMLRDGRLQQRSD